MPTQSHSRARAALVLGVALLLLATLIGPATAQSSNERRLEETQARLDAIRADIEDARSRSAEEEARLAEAEKQLAEITAVVAETEQAVRRQQQAVEQARQQLERVVAESNRRGQIASDRAVTLFVEGPGMPLEALLTSQTPKEALQRSAYIDVVTRADRRLIEDLDASRVEVGAQRDHLAGEEATLRDLLEERRVVMAEVEELKNDRAIALAEANADVERLEGEEEHLAEEEAKVAALAGRASRSTERASRSRTPAAEPAAASEPGPAPGPDGWVWPARGPVTSEFGPRWGRLHAGVDIGDPTGAPIFAANNGTVSFVGTMSGYGNIVLIDHGGGVVTAYAHQSAFAVKNGQKVSSGQRIGSVGCTGSCTGPHLHFEVRVNGDARNPRGYLP